MFMTTTDAYLYLYAAAIRAGAPDPAVVAEKGARDFTAFRAQCDVEREAAADAKFGKMKD